ncbi:DNA-binding protein [Enterococcus sp. AZ196]|uniref:DNA-binding protein n=1 Tax=Enterococcus sp. AZ196 TaxID=2774659 RepID=UPI003D289678
MKIEIPIEVDDEIIHAIAQQIIETALIESNGLAQQGTIDLPPYPTRKEMKKILHIGDERLNSWIIHGLSTISFGKETRFDREDVKEFLNKLKSSC